jgi:hypothetical protein
MSHQLKYQCCFCGSQIVQNDHDPIVLTITVNSKSASGVSQDLRCHGQCLKDRLQRGVPTLMDA